MIGDLILIIGMVIILIAIALKFVDWWSGGSV